MPKSHWGQDLESMVDVKKLSSKAPHPLNAPSCSEVRPVKNSLLHLLTIELSGNWLPAYRRVTKKPPLCVKGGSAADSVRHFRNTYAANQLPDDSMVRRWRREFLTGRTSLQDGAYRGKGALDDNFFTSTILSRSCPQWLLGISCAQTPLGRRTLPNWCWGAVCYECILLKKSDRV